MELIGAAPPIAKLSLEIMDMIVLEVERPRQPFRECDEVQRDPKALSDLSMLRLTCRAFHLAVTPRLFRSFWLWIDFDSRRSNPLRILQQLADSAIVSYVRRLIVAPKHLVHRLEFERWRCNVAALADILPQILIKFRGLSELHIGARNPCAESRHTSMLPKHEQSRSLFTQAVGNSLKLLTATRECRIQELQLRMPLAYDFVEISQLLRSASNLGTVRNLSIEILDQSGLGGFSLKPYPKSGLQALHPNSKYSGCIFDVLSVVPNITALRITGSHILSFEGLKSARLSRLRILKFRRVRIPAEAFQELLLSNICDDIDILELDGCCIWAEGWQAVFSKLCERAELHEIQHRTARHSDHIVSTLESTSAHLQAKPTASSGSFSEAERFAFDFLGRKRNQL